MDTALNFTEQMCFPQTHLLRKHNCTKTLQWIMRLQPHCKDVLFKLALLINTFMNHNHYMKPSDHCRASAGRARTNKIFQCWTRFFPKEKIRQI